MQYRMIFAASMALGSGALANSFQLTKAPRSATYSAIGRRQGEAIVLNEPMVIAAGESFDGEDATYDRGVSCSGDSEGGEDDAVFILEAGASLSNVRIGPNQVEGVHCLGGCTVTNVWWDAVCEDAFSIKEQGDGETTTINGGGASGASDKVIQHNGGGTVVINDFTVSDFGKLYRSCGNCDEMPARHVIISGGSASNGDVLAGINSNMGDTASISGISVEGVEDQCLDFEGVVGSGEPEELGPCANVGSGGASPAPVEGDSPSVTTPGVPSATETESSEEITVPDEDEEEVEEEDEEEVTVPDEDEEEVEEEEEETVDEEDEEEEQEEEETTDEDEEDQDDEEESADDEDEEDQDDDEDQEDQEDEEDQEDDEDQEDEEDQEDDEDEDDE